MQTVRVARRLTQSERRILASVYGTGGRQCRHLNPCPPGRDLNRHDGARWLRWFATFAAVVRDAAEQHGKAEGIRLLLEHVSLEHAVALCSGGPVLLPADIHLGADHGFVVGDRVRVGGDSRDYVIAEVDGGRLRLDAEDRPDPRRTMADLVRRAQERAALPIHMPIADSDLGWQFHDEAARFTFSEDDLRAIGERMPEAVERSLGIIGTPRTVD